MSTTRTTAVLVALLLAVAACGGDDASDATETSATTSAQSATTGPPTSTAPPTTAPATTAAPATTSTTSATTAPPTTSSEPTISLVALQRQVEPLCDPARFAALPMTGADPQRVGEVLAFLDADRDAVAPVESLDVPVALAVGFAPVLEASASAREALEAAEEAAAAGDLVDAERLVSRHFAHLRSIAGRLAVMGLSCGSADPARAATADLNVPLDLHAEQINVGFGSVWVSQKRGKRGARRPDLRRDPRHH